MAKPNYPLCGPLIKTCSHDLSRLKRWIEEASGGKKWIGRIYVASTIDWSESDGFSQSGCAPNFMADWWSLCCCKHNLLRYQDLGEWLEECPVFIFTLAGQSGGDWQPLVSVAKITKYFDSPEAYAQFVLTETKLRESRLSRLTQIQHRSNKFQAWHFGDCHSDTEGKLGPPVEAHVHWNEESWKEDNRSRTRKLLSQEFLVWDKPRIVGKKRMGRDGGYGREILAIEDFLEDTPKYPVPG